MSRRRRHGAAALADVIDRHSRRVAQHVFPASDLATVQADMSLLLDCFSIPIPEGDYLVTERFKFPDPMTSTQADGGHDHAVSTASAGAHQHPAIGAHFHGSVTGTRVRDSAPDEPADFASHDHAISSDGVHQHDSAGAHTHTASQGSSAPHSHAVVRPDELRPLEPGDRVVVILLDSNSVSPTPVVIERL